MDPISYSPRRAAQLLKTEPKELTSLLRKDAYSALDLLALRQKMRRMPPELGPRCQLFLNFKGGTGKTSLSTSYAFRMAEMGYRVLLIDLDSQGHATKCLGLDGENFEKTLLDVLVKRTPISDVIVQSGMPQLDLVPSNLTMSTVDLALMPLAGREFKLRNALREVEGQYDLTVLDAPPSFGLLNLNALMAAADLIVPVLADFLSFHGLKLLFETVQGLEEDLQHHLAHVFIVINAFNATFKLAKEAQEALQQHYGDYLCKTVIRQCTKFAQASSEGRPVFVADPESKGAQDLQSLIDELLGQLLKGGGKGKPQA
ncbi:MAG: AAA family ATPase [Deltaproteobacteria bacterium]|nr:AAA family ATPase [Deltaproteobacteria bacterium]